MQLDPVTARQVTARQVSASLLRLRLRAPFFATLALFARVELSEHIPTAATDGRDVFLNRAFFGALTPSEQDGLLLHEVLHAALLHVPRRGARDPKLWNVAADIVVNGLIAKESGFALPAGGLRNGRLEHLSVEEVYDLLARDDTVRVAAPWADLLEEAPGNADGPPPHARAALEGHWRNAYHQARLVAQSGGRGAMPGGLERELGALEPAQLDWRSYLWRYLVRTPVDFADYDRRFVGQGLYLETLSGESVDVHVAIDTSGSVDDRQLAAFLGEVAGIAAAYPHLHCDLYYADTALNGPYPIIIDGSMPRPIGAGGTDFRPFFARMTEQPDLGAGSGAVLVYLTDGEGVFPNEPPPWPVLWVVTPGGRDLTAFPFGETARLLTGA